MVIPFDMGFTAITGPNGSGKSNCGDAIQFVLGPKSTKALRASNVSELIFNGGGRGKAAKQMSVTLVFAGIPLASSVKLMTEGEGHDEDAGDTALVRMGKRLCGGVDYFDGDRFFTRERGVRLLRSRSRCFGLPSSFSPLTSVPGRTPVLSSSSPSSFSSSSEE